MFLSRFVPALAVGALVVATEAPASAAESAEVEGIGSTTGTLSVLGIDAGELLDLELLGDRGDASNDPALGEPAGLRSSPRCRSTPCSSPPRSRPSSASSTNSACPPSSTPHWPSSA